jgi:hypothetical protein
MGLDGQYEGAKNQRDPSHGEYVKDQDNILIG